MKKIFAILTFVSVIQWAAAAQKPIDTAGSFPPAINGISTAGMNAGIDIFYKKHSNLRGLECYLTVNYSYNVVAQDGHWYGLLSEHWNYRPGIRDGEYVALAPEEYRKLRTDAQSLEATRRALRIYKQAGICAASSSESYVWRDGERAAKEKEAEQQRKLDKEEAQQREWDRKARVEQDRQKARERAARDREVDQERRERARETENDRRRREYL